MPMKARYTVVGGEVISEVRSGVRRDYVPDPLGSTVALLDNTQSVTDSWEYWPYGEVRSGSSATPFQFVGTLGYYKDSSRRTYVRARHYRQNLGRWMTVDPFWPLLHPFTYSDLGPLSYADPEGLAPYCICGNRKGHAKVGGYPSGGKYYSCYLRVCKLLCPGPHDPFLEAVKACTNRANCQEVFGWLNRACISGNGWKACGEYFTVPGGAGFNEAYANSSNYPKPNFQLAAADQCCVECRMRVCCHFYELSIEWQILVQKGFRKCRFGGNV